MDSLNSDKEFTACKLIEVKTGSSGSKVEKQGVDNVIAIVID